MRELHGVRGKQTAAMAVLQLVAEAGVVNAQQGAEPAFADLMSARAENGLDETRTDALMPQPETGKISYVHHPR
jgi:hypothetical protein